jgi:hypothetical protein
MRNTLLAGLVGGVVMFVWASFAHLATPLATAGLEPLPAEAATVATLHAALGERSGLYFFPYLQGSGSRASADQKARMQLGPTGLLAYKAPGSPVLMPRQLLVELLLEIVESLLTALVIVAVAGIPRRLGLAVAVGVIAAVSTNMSYWNWYGFSWDYTLANAFTEFMKYLLAGAAMTAFLAWRGRGRANSRGV